MAISVVGSKSTFGCILREIRKRNGVNSPAELARKMGGVVSVSGILKRERGELKITEDYINAFIKAVRVSSDERKFIRKHLSLFKLQFDLWKSEKSILGINEEATARLEESINIQCFSPTLIPHLLQTSAYARGILETYGACAEGEELDKTVSVRLKSAERIHKEKHRLIKLINWEPALYNLIAGVESMVEQLERLRAQADVGHIQYGIIPIGVQANIPNDSTFTIHDGLFVTAESSLGNLYSGEKVRCEWASHNFDRLWSVAVFGDAKRSIIENAISWIGGKNDISYSRFKTQ